MARRGYRARPTSGGVPLAIGYIRVSSEDQATEGVSLPAQHAEVTRYIAAHGWILDAEYQDILTGKRDDRPGYQAALARVRQLRAEGKAVVLVVTALDRLGRRLMERLRCREEFKALGVRMHSIRDNGEVTDLVASILGAVAEEEVARLGMRVRQVWAEVRAHGFYQCGANLPWGYVSRAATPDERAQGAPMTVLDVDALAAPRVTEVFQRVAQGESIRSVAKWTAALPDEVRGLRYADNAERAARRHKSVRDQPREGSVRMVQAVLRNPVYCARHERDGECIGRWPRLIDDGTWGTVQQRLDSYAQAPRADRQSYLLTGFLTCAKCSGRLHGERYTWRSAAGQTQKARRYRCTGASGQSNACTQSSDVATIDGLVMAEVAALFAAAAGVDPERLRAEYQRLQAPPAGVDHSREITRLEGQAADNRRRISSAARLLVDGALDRAGYDALVAEEQAALAAAETELARLQRVALVPEPDCKIDDVLAVDWRTLMAELDAPEAIRDVLALLVAAVVPVRVKRGQYRVEVEWTKLGRRLREAMLGAAQTSIGEVAAA